MARIRHSFTTGGAPTNIADDGAVLCTANLGRWHITSVETGMSGRRPVDCIEEQRP